MAEGFLSALLTKYNRIVNNGVILPQRSALNVVGATATDDPANDATNLTIVGGSGSSGGATSVTFNFTQPAVNSTVNVSVGTTAGIQGGQSIAIGGGGYYINTSTVDATHLLLLNTGAAVNASPAATILSGDLVTVAGQGASLAAAAPLNGQVQQLQAGTFTPAGMRAYVNVQSYGAKADSATTDNAPLINASVQAAVSSGLTDVVLPFDPANPAGYYGVQSPVFLNSRGVRFGGQHRLADSEFVKIRRVGYFGPTIFVGADIPDPPGFATRTYGSGTVHTALFESGLAGTLEACTFVDFADDQGAIAVGGLALNGLANASFQFYIDPLTYDPGSNLAACLCSRGGIDSASILTAFALEIGISSGSGTTREVFFKFPTNSTGSSKTCSSGTTGLSASTLQHVLCQLDGTNNLMTICIDGVLRGKTTVPGGMTIVQSRYEDLCQGFESATWPVVQTSQIIGGPLQMSGVQVLNSVLHPITSGTALGTTVFTPSGNDFVNATGALITSTFASANRPRQGWTTWLGGGSTVWSHWHGTCGAAYQTQNEIDHLCTYGIETLAAINCHLHHLDLADAACLTMGLFSYDSHVEHSTLEADAASSTTGHCWGVMIGLGTQFMVVGPSVQLTDGLWGVITNNGGTLIGGWHDMTGDGGVLAIYPPQSTSGTATTVSLKDWYVYDDGGVAVGIAGIKAWGVRLLIDGGDTGVSEISTCVAYELDNCELSLNTNRPGISAGAPGVLNVIAAMNPPRVLRLPDSQYLGGNFGATPLPWVNPSKPGLVAVGDQNEQTGAVIFATDANHTMGVNEMLFGHWELTSSVSLTASRTLLSPYNALDQFARVHNATTGGQSIVIGAVTITNGSFASIRNNGSGWVTA